MLLLKSTCLTVPVLPNRGGAVPAPGISGMDLLFLVEGVGDGGGGKCGGEVDGEAMAVATGRMWAPRRRAGDNRAADAQREPRLAAAQRPGEAHADSLCERTKSHDGEQQVSISEQAAQRWVVPGRLDGACAPIPTFNDAERRFFRLALARAWGTRAVQVT